MELEFDSEFEYYYRSWPCYNTVSLERGPWYDSKGLSHV